MPHDIVDGHIGHNHARDHLHSHLPPEDAAEELQVLATQFIDGFVKAEVIDDRLIISDLRMGAEPKFVFRHAVAERGNPHWNAIPTEQVRTLFGREDIIWTFERLLNP